MQTTNTNPSTYLGFGTWELWGSGKVPVGVDTSQTEFSTVEKSGGNKTVTLTTSQIPSHTHTFTGTSHSHSIGSHSHSIDLTTDSASVSHSHSYTHASTTTGSHTLVLSEIPAHQHHIRANQGSNPIIGFGAGNSGNYIRIFDSLDFGKASIGNEFMCNSEGGGSGHTHSISLTSTTTGTQSISHSHSLSGSTGSASGTTTSVTASGSNSNTGGGSSHTNLQPYITCYMFKRTK